jgi:hypothetical protein
MDWLSLAFISTVSFSAWLDLLGVITPADKAHGFIEARKPPHHAKVPVLEGVKHCLLICYLL